MSEQPTKPPLEDDVLLLKRFDKEADSREHQTLGLITLIGLAIGFFCAALWLPPPIVKAICSMAGAINLLYFSILRAGRNAKKILPPFEVLERVAASGDHEAAEVLLPLYERYQYQEGEKYDAILIQYLSALDTLDIKIDYKPLTEILAGILHRVQSSSPELSITIIETFVRCHATEVLTKLLMLSERSAPTSTLQRVRTSAREAIILLSEEADFGAVHEIPAKVKELYRLHFFSDNGSVIHTERHIWLVQALTHLLPRLTKVDAGLFDKKHRTYLHTFATGGSANYNSVGRSASELKQAIVLALGNMEDTDALSTIFHLAHSDAPTDHEQDTRTMAKKQLAILTKIKEKQKVGSMLLRASDAPATAQEQLLRPAHATQETQPETLLRPHLGE